MESKYVVLAVAASAGISSILTYLICSVPFSRGRSDKMYSEKMDLEQMAKTALLSKSRLNRNASRLEMQCLLRLQQLYQDVIPRKNYMVCMALITKGNNSLSVPIIIDSRWEVDLVLNMGDVERLGTKFTRHGAVRFGDGKEVVSLTKYGEVTVRIFFQNNAFVEAEMTPAVFKVDEVESSNARNEIESETFRVPGARLLGYSGLNRMGLIQDFDQHCLSYIS